MSHFDRAIAYERFLYEQAADFDQYYRLLVLAMIEMILDVLPVFGPVSLDPVEMWNLFTQVSFPLTELGAYFNLADQQRLRKHFDHQWMFVLGNRRRLLFDAIDPWSDDNNQIAIEVQSRYFSHFIVTFYKTQRYTTKQDFITLTPYTNPNKNIPAIGYSPSVFTRYAELYIELAHYNFDLQTMEIKDTCQLG